MVSILLDPRYSNTAWCTSKVEHLIAQLKLRRIPYAVMDDLNALQGHDHFPFVVGADSEWLQAVVRGCNYLGLHPILLCGEGKYSFQGAYSSVSSAANDSMEQLISRLRRGGARRICLYAANPASIDDQGRCESYLRVMGQDEGAIFYCKVSLEDCYRSFCAAPEPFDTALCVNGFSAISLVRYLKAEQPEYLERLRIICLQDVQMTEFYRQWIFSIDQRFEEYAKAALMIYNDLTRAEPCVSHIDIRIDWDMHDLDRVLPSFPPAAPLLTGRPANSKGMFHPDLEAREMQRLENIFYSCSEEDRMILLRLMQGDTYAMIEEQCFLSASAIKYRAKRIVAEAGMKNKEELLALMRKYLPALSSKIVP